MLRTLLVAAVAVFGLALLALAIAGGSPAQRITQPMSAIVQRDLPDQLVGMTINLYYTDDLGPYLEAVDHLAAMGFNSLQVVTPAFQQHGGSAQIELLVGPGRGPRRNDLLKLLRYAKARGMRTCLMPQINFIAPRGNEWRGKIQPPRWETWWRSYAQFLGHFLDIASDADVDVFAVGCELVSTQKPAHLEQWRAMIAMARRRYSGMLIYSTVFNSYQSPGFWDQLDAIGISAYWDLTTHADAAASPSAAQLQSRWVQIRKQVLDFAVAQDRPVLLTEVGYPSLPWALSDPWNYVCADQVDADVDAQARGYEAFIEAWGDMVVPPLGRDRQTQPDERIAGVLFYAWDVNPKDPAQDTGYGIISKPAYKIVQRWLIRSER